MVAVGVLPAACGGGGGRPVAPGTAAVPQGPTTALGVGVATSTGDRRFVRTPDVALVPATARPKGPASLLTTVRVDRSLPQGTTGVRAALGTTAATADPYALQRLPGTRRCYAEGSVVPDGVAVPRDGQVVTVRLTVRGARGQVLTERVRVHVVSRSSADAPGRTRALARRLGCPRLPPARRCHGDGAWRITCRRGERAVTATSAD